MNKAVSAIVVAGFALALGGCGATSKVARMLGSGKNSVPQEELVQTNQNLAIPPDLRLPPPGSAESERQVTAPAAPVATVPSTEPAAPTDVAATAPAAPKGDIYAQYGISTVNPDGTKKSDEQLQKELKAAYLAKKRQTNPGYGTIWNIGEIFKGG